ncbi:hypothetical protein TeGR_g108 [Tetraparma gracilis]|uniref:Uncharacterized protein n=1 Tax=Tetraparma gracilis TaxID=2962635 RepID=A0ABQ6MX33_9STRA|nr:hypothetical protein TeGR_g108 [Tetraparma gracilis]
MSELASVDSAQRRSSARRASALLDKEQERRESQATAAAALDAEQARRVEEIALEDKKQEEERKVNQVVAAKMAAAEQQERASEKGAAMRKSLVAEAGVLEELQDEVDESEHVAELDDGRRGQAAGERAVVSDKASANVDDIMAADGDDESLRKYKEQLLGQAAKGDRGDTSDKRKVVVTEFRVVFEDGKTPDIVHTLDTEEGVAKMAENGISIKEGAGFKFKLKFRVNHEILTGLKFTNKTMKGVFWQTDDLVIGSFAPQTNPYEFEFPRYGFNNAPSGMMFRGTYKNRNSFSDTDGNNHLEFEYKANITR